MIKAWVRKRLNYWMTLSCVCMFMLTCVSVQYSKLCQTAHAPLHPFPGEPSLQCTDLEHSIWERSKHTHKGQFHAETCMKYTHTHTYVCACTHTRTQFTDAWVFAQMHSHSISIHCRFCHKQSIEVDSFVSHVHRFFTHRRTRMHAVLCVIKRSVLFHCFSLHSLVSWFCSDFSIMSCKSCCSAARW